jgi:hypothetical protein
MKAITKRVRQGKTENKRQGGSPRSKGNEGVRSREAGMKTEFERQEGKSEIVRQGKNRDLEAMEDSEVELQKGKPRSRGKKGRAKS